MDNILNFAKDNYLILLILGGVFLLALIGYLYDRYQNRDIKIAKDNKSDDAILTESLMEEPKPEDTQVENLNESQPIENPIPLVEQQAPAEEDTTPQLNGFE